MRFGCARTKGGAGERPRKDAEFADEAVRLYEGGTCSLRE